MVNLTRTNERVDIQLCGVSVNRSRYARIELDVIKTVGCASVSALDKEIDGFHITAVRRDGPDFTADQLLAITKMLDTYREPYEFFGSRCKGTRCPYCHVGG